MSSNNKVLVIDDEKGILDKFVSFFEDKSVEIDAFAGTQEFFVETQARDLSQYKVVFIDYHLPKETGIDFLEKFDKTTKLPTTYVITGDLSLEGNIKRKPHIVLLNKPVNLEKLWSEEISFLF